MKMNQKTKSNPFLASSTITEADTALALRAGSGDAEALSELVERHSDWIYNLSLRFVLNPADAADLAQESLVKIVTRIGSFAGRSAFRTWAYRIVMNTFLDWRRGALEQAITDFDRYGNDLDQIPVEDLGYATPEHSAPERALLVKEAKLGCMLGMLLCLDRTQRIAYLLGEILEAPSDLAGEILEISPAAFRKRLERARRDLSEFMNQKCGLINTSNPCRCEKKTAGFIKAGWVDPENARFTDERLKSMRDYAPDASTELERLYMNEYAELFREHPFYERPELLAALRKTISAPQSQRVFRLNGDDRD